MTITFKSGRNKVRANNTGNQVPTVATTIDATVRRVQPVWWETNGSTSNAVNLGPHERIEAIHIPSSGWAATATRIYVDVSDENGTYRPARDIAGNPMYIVVGASAASIGVVLTDDERAKLSCRWVKFKSMTDAGAAVTQTAAVSVQLVSTGAATANPYSSVSFRARAGGKFTAQVLGAGRVRWDVCDGTTTTTTYTATLNKSSISKTLDITCFAAFEYANSELVISHAGSTDVDLGKLPRQLSKFRFSSYEDGNFYGDLGQLSKRLKYLQLSGLNVCQFTGDIGELSQSLETLILDNLDGGAFTGSIDGLSKNLTTLQLEDLPNSVLSGSLDNLSTKLTSCVLYNIGGAFTGAFKETSRQLIELVIGKLPGSAITGDLDDLAKSIIILTIDDLRGDISGTIGDLSKVITNLVITNMADSEIRGDLSTDLPTAINTELSLFNLPAGVHGAFTSSIGAIVIRCYNAGFTAEDTDNMIINLEAKGSSSGDAIFESNRTSASDAALAALLSRGWTVTFA